MPELATFEELLEAYRNEHHDWDMNEREFLALMDLRRIGKRGIKRMIDRRMSTVQRRRYWDSATAGWISEYLQHD